MVSIRIILLSFKPKTALQLHNNSIDIPRAWQFGKTSCEVNNTKKNNRDGPSNFSSALLLVCHYLFVSTCTLVFPKQLPGSQLSVLCFQAVIEIFFFFLATSFSFLIRCQTQLKHPLLCP